MNEDSLIDQIEFASRNLDGLLSWISSNEVSPTAIGHALAYALRDRLQTIGDDRAVTWILDDLQRDTGSYRLTAH